MEVIFILATKARVILTGIFVVVAVTRSTIITIKDSLVDAVRYVVNV